MSVLIVVATSVAFVMGAFSSFAPYTSDAAKKWYQIKFMCSKPGDIGIFVEPDGPEALSYKIGQLLLKTGREVPVNAIVLVVSYVNKDEAVCNWNNSLVVLPRRWIRKVK
jgi:hypothetical protein